MCVCVCVCVSVCMCIPVRMCVRALAHAGIISHGKVFD